MLGTFVWGLGELITHTGLHISGQCREKSPRRRLRDCKSTVCMVHRLNVTWHLPCVHSKCSPQFPRLARPAYSSCFAVFVRLMASLPQEIEDRGEVKHDNTAKARRTHSQNRLALQTSRHMHAVCHRLRIFGTARC